MCVTRKLTRTSPLPTMTIKQKMQDDRRPQQRNLVCPSIQGAHCDMPIAGTSSSSSSIPQRTQQPPWRKRKREEIQEQQEDLQQKPPRKEMPKPSIGKDQQQQEDTQQASDQNTKARESSGAGDTNTAATMHATRRIHKTGLTDAGANSIINHSGSTDPSMLHAKSNYGQADAGTKSITSVYQGHCGGKTADASSMHASLKTQQKKCAYCKVKQKRGEKFKSNPAMIQLCPS